MTKRRDPFSAEEALYRICDFIGWDVAARIAGREERTVRQWSEPDVDRHCPADVAVRLDIAWRAAGGAGMPFHDAHRHHLDAAAAPTIDIVDLVDLPARFRDVVREAAEATDAVIVALPGTSPTACFTAVREIDDSIAAKRTLRRLLVAASMAAPVICPA